MHDEEGAGGRNLPPLHGLSSSSSAGRSEHGYPVVPADQLLEVAAALSEGATRLHAELRHLDPEDRDAVLDIVAGQLGEIVTLWTSLVRGVVTAGAEDETRAQVWTHREEDEDEHEPPPRPSQRVVAVAADEDARPRSHENGSGDEAPQAPSTLHVNPYRRPPPPGDDGPTPVESLTRDELTGVLTRQAGFAALTKEIDRCRHGGDRFVLGYLNVDGLKAVNESRGPRAGDELLRKVTAALRATLRSYDIIARLGGDEFLFSLPGADMATAELRFNEFAVILSEEAPGGSASVGFAQLRESDTIDDLIARADTALLKSRRGRRRAAR